MSENNKLNQSLDDILKGRKASAARRGRPGVARRTPGGKPAPAAPVGGVKKTTKAAKGAKPAIPTGPALKTQGESKIFVSGLPHDVSEPQIKEYFGKSIGPVKKVFLTYGPNGMSRGIATVVFVKPTAAAEAANTHNGLKVDGRPIKVEVILGASDIAPAAAPKALNERISQPKGKATPKPATGPKPATEKKKKEKKPRAKAAGRVKKTAEELDAEMADYFVGGAAPAAAADGDTAMNGGAVQNVANGGDTGMDDDVM